MEKIEFIMINTYEIFLNENKWGLSKNLSICKIYKTKINNSIVDDVFYNEDEIDFFNLLKNNKDFNEIINKISNNFNFLDFYFDFNSEFKFFIMVRVN